MRYFLLFVLLCTCISYTFTRPAEVDENGESDAEEVEYEGDSDEAEADDVIGDEDPRANNDQEQVADGPEDEASLNHVNGSLVFRGNSYLQHATNNMRVAKDGRYDLSADKPCKNEEMLEQKSRNFGNEYESLPDQRNSERYIENSDANDQLEAAQHLTNRDVNNFKLVQTDANQINKRTPGTHTMSYEEGDLLFHNNREQTNKPIKTEYNDKAADISEQSRFFKQYYNYNTMQADDRGVREDKNYVNIQNLNRDRRQAQVSSQNEPIDFSYTPTVSADLKNSATEGEEEAIKRHVKKLSQQELEELLNSLSVEKRELLKKIMGNEYETSDNLKKREITKKAGAVEENNVLESGQSDISKLQVEGTNTETSQKADTTETSKQTELHMNIDDIAATKITYTSTASGSENKAEFAHGKSDCNLNSGVLSVDLKNDANLNANAQATSKTENKREINLDDLTNSEIGFDDTKMLKNDLSFKEIDNPSNEQGDFYSQDQDLSQLMNDDAELQANNGNGYKREAFVDKDTDLSDTMKSLEDSFPNSNAYDDTDPYLGSEMAPLIRVKRKNTDIAVKKRSAALLPDSKVAYFPYRAENEDEDNDEGNEFDDNGFYDRTCNLAKSEVNEKSSVENAADDLEVPFERENPISNDINQSKLLETVNEESDTMSLGSDTDSVLSGGEGVDENLMYNTGSRNRRIAEESPKDEQAGDIAAGKQDRSRRTVPVIDDGMKTVPENDFNAPNYQENEAFGPLLRNYESELRPYKRMRQLKTQEPAQEARSNTKL